MRIDVTADDIRRGERCTTDRCPVALAIRRAVPDAMILVTPTYVIVSTPAWKLNLLDEDMPAGVREFVLSFDRSTSPVWCTMAPFSFDLPVPVPEPEYALA